MLQNLTDCCVTCMLLLPPNVGRFQIKYIGRLSLNAVNLYADGLEYLLGQSNSI
jgi:hypothetical protein